jgi:hypothetical protein
VIIEDASGYDLAPGDLLTVEVTAAEPVYCFATPVGVQSSRSTATADD